MTIPDTEAKIRPLTAKIVIKALLFFALTALILWLWQASIVRISQNFEEVDPGKFYRSAQLTPQELEEKIKLYKIKTVISLRGAPEKSYWVDAQRKVLKNLNVQFVPISWTTDYFPESAQLKNYLQTLKTAAYPILVHCRTGADRTGEATALYAIDFMKLPKEEAISKYLSFKYWHVEAFHPAKKEFVRRYQGIEQALSSYDVCAKENQDFAPPGRCPDSTEKN
jgi:protein tyrosine/serine phosphatase